MKKLDSVLQRNDEEALLEKAHDRIGLPRDHSEKKALGDLIKRQGVTEKLRLLKSIALLTMILAALVGPLVNANGEQPGRAEAIIVFIGDGMGLSLIRAADIYSREVYGKSLSINEIPTVSVATNNSADSAITDSAAAATAIFSGYKTGNGSVNVLPDETRVDSMAHAAQRAGMSVGIVTNTRLTDATPAALYSHSKNRSDEQSIADQLFPFAPTVAMGGGLQYFVPPSVHEKSKRTDQKNLVEEFKQAGYASATKGAELDEASLGAVDKLVGLFALSQLNYELDRRHGEKHKDQPSLARMTTAALSVLSKNPKGFFLMVEGGRIDHACHRHDLKAAIYEMIAFDEAVLVGLNFHKTHPNTLILVTADHETGGLGLGRGAQYALNLSALKPIRSSVEYAKEGFEKGDAKLEQVLRASGFELTEAEKEALFKKVHKADEQSNPATREAPMIAGNVFPLIQHFLIELQNERAGVAWTSFAHTAQPVLVFAVGPGASEFSGVYDNTDIAWKMARVLGVTLK